MWNEKFGIQTQPLGKDRRNLRHFPVFFLIFHCEFSFRFIFSWFFIVNFLSGSFFPDFSLWIFFPVHFFLIFHCEFFFPFIFSWFFIVNFFSGSFFPDFSLWIFFSGSFFPDFSLRIFFPVHFFLIFHCEFFFPFIFSWFFIANFFFRFIFSWFFIVNFFSGFIFSFFVRASSLDDTCHRILHVLLCSCVIDNFFRCHSVRNQRRHTETLLWCIWRKNRRRFSNSAGNRPLKWSSRRFGLAVKTEGWNWSVFRPRPRHLGTIHPPLPSRR